MKPKPIYKRLSAFLLCFALLAGLLPVTASAATVGGFTIEGDASAYSYDVNSGVLTISGSAALTISNTNSSTATSDRIVISSGVSANLTLSGVNIQAPVQTSAIDVPSGASLTLTLETNSTNTLAVSAATSSLANNAGIHVPEGASLTIQCATASGDNHQCNNACGHLTVTGGEPNGNGFSGAGIGGNGAGPQVSAGGENSGTSRINGGNITITGGTSAYPGPGIGGGSGSNGGGDCGEVYITGGIVRIYGGSSNASSMPTYGAAGIGGGNTGIGNSGGIGGIVVITGGTVVVTGGNGTSNGYGGAGIGGGSSAGSGGAGGDGGTVIILTEVNVKGGQGVSSGSGGTPGNAIGGGFGNSGSNNGDEGDGIRPSTGGNNTYEVYGNLELPDGVEIPSGVTVTIPSGSSLTVPEGTELVVDGTLKVEEGGSLSNSGTVSGDGSLTGDGTVTNSGGTIDVDDNSFAATVTLSINGQGTTATATYGGSVTLTANVTGGSEAVNSGTVTFYRGDSTTGTVLNSSGAAVSNGQATYDLTLSDTPWKPGDSPYTITAVYSGGTGLLSGSGQGSLTVSKASQDTAPAAPTVSATTPPTANSITLNAVTTTGQGAVQYGYVQGTDGGAPSSWQDETTFNNLQAGTAYTFYTRYEGNAYYNPSGPSSPGTTIYTAHATPTGDEGYTIDYAAETVTAADGYEVRLTESDTWITGSINIPPGGTFQVRHAATTDGSPASDAATVNVAARPNAPTLTIDNEDEGVTVLTDYFYNTTGTGNYSDSGWTQGTGNLVKVEAGQTIYIYRAAVTSGNNPAFKSNVQTLAAPDRGTAPTLPTIDYEDEALSGTNENMEWGVAPSGQSVPSQWEDCSDNMSLSALGWTGGEMTVYFRTAATTTNYASAPTTEALTIPARPAAPDAPKVSDKTDTSITITALDGVQYRLDDSGSWVTPTEGSYTFTGLSANTEYTIYARYPAVTQGENPTFASAEATLKVTTKTSAGQAPTVNQSEIEVTDTTITLPYDAAWEYSTDGTDWNSGDGANVFTNLFHSKPYTFYVRVAETTTAEASATATVTVWTAHSAPWPREGYSINYTEETISIYVGYEVNTAQDFSGATITSGASLEDYIGGTLYIRRAATAGGAPASAGTAIPLTRPAAPAVQGVNETVQGLKDGKITGLTAGTAYEISGDDGQSWTDATLTGTEIIDLAPGDYQVRAKSTDTSFTGEAASVTISTGAEPTYNLNVTAPAFDSVYTGYAQPEAKPITISSAGNSDATISGVTVDNASFVIGGSGSTVPAGGSISTWTIRPAAGLSVGTYAATITVTYDGGATATAQVSFTVTRRPSSGGGGTTPSNPTYTPGVTEPENGAVTVTPEKPKAGDTVTITAEPAERYKVDSVTVTDEDGDPVDVTAQEDGSYTFTQPEGDVTITVTFDVDMPFTDVPEGAWYIEGAKYVYGNFIMSGTSPTTFSPSTPVSRGMIMQILYNMVGQPDVEGGSNFTDVDEDYWSADAIAWAVANGVAGGFGDGTFRPDEGLTREQMAVVLRNFAYQMGWDISASGDLSRFTDIPEDSWARDALAWAFAEGLLTGTSGTTMAPTGEASRAQIAVIMMRFCQRYIDNVE